MCHQQENFDNERFKQMFEFFTNLQFPNKTKPIKMELFKILHR